MSFQHVCNARTSSTQAQHARRSSPSQQPGAEPEVVIKTKAKQCKCHVSCQLVCNALTCDDRHAAAPPSSSKMEQKTPENCAALPGQCLLGRAATLSAKSNLPGYRRRRRNSLVSAKKNQKEHAQEVAMSVLRAPVTTPTKAQRRRSATRWCPG